MTAAYQLLVVMFSPVLVFSCCAALVSVWDRYWRNRGV